MDYPKCIYTKDKTYPDGSRSFSVKYGIDLSSVSKVRHDNITSISTPNSPTTTHPVQVVKMANLQRSSRRVYATVRDLCLCNTFNYFVTLTFGKDKIQDRLDDNLTRKAFSKWQKEIKSNYPNMYYIAVPEYHKKGGLHYHLLVGGIDWQDLDLEFHEWKECMDRTIPVYSINCWKYGFSTISEIQCPQACHLYVLKYITKGDSDIRFFNKKRYHCSHNLRRPEVASVTYYTPHTIADFQQATGLDLSYADRDKSYYIFE